LLKRNIPNALIPFASYIINYVDSEKHLEFRL